jgi:hypothetical protein
MVKKPNVALLCQWIKTMAMDHSRNDRVFKNCCISDEMGGIEDEEEIGNVGSEHERVSGECQPDNVNCENSAAKTC